MFEQPVVALFDVDLFANHTSQYTSPKSWGVHWRRLG
jgi:hypothetical protein